MRPYTIPVNHTRSTEYERWASRVTGKQIMQGSESDLDFESTLDFEDTPLLIVINKQVERPLTEHTATLDVQVSDTEMLRLYVDDDLLERGVEKCMEEGSTLEEVKDKMLDDMTQFEMRNRRLYGPFDYQLERERIFNHNRWKQSILLAAEQRWQDDRLTDGKPLGVFNPVKVRKVAFRSRESTSGCYRVPEEFEKDILTPA